ncbi:hypothetical protein EDC04DRAFT_2960654 [Pisolithus marmoratus]|nr:hypothetical protein EDC04DRAFT_2960654 [Pisolithus marmoratus]
MPPVKQKCKYVIKTMDQVTCETCGLLFSARGIKSHNASCAWRSEKRREVDEFTSIAAELVEIQRKAPSLGSTHSDSFKTKFHPKSGHPVALESFSTFDHSHHDAGPKSIAENDSEPWHPFQMCGDFEFSELVHKAALNKDLMNQFLGLIQCLFEKHVVNIHHTKHDLEFNVHYCLLWDWAMDVLQDPRLQPHFVWDAQHLYKHNGECFEHFIDEPWTGDRWWNIQSSLPQEDAAPFAFILYTDKSHLSSSGKVKAYPIIMHCGNLPTHIRNSNHGLGGGQLVPEDSANDRKLSYTNLKRVVWHQAFLTLSLTYDDSMRTLYLIILILSADYEEQCMMSLIRGLNSSCPCPICLVPSNELCDHSKTHPCRTSEEAIACFELYKKSWCIGDEMMQSQSCNHLFVELKKILASIGCHAEKTVDTQHEVFPCWRNFNHFKSVTNVFFSDGNKLLDIAKQIIFTAQNILTHQAHPMGFALLCCIASYLHYHMYILLDIHMETTLTAGECELRIFQCHLEEYIAMHDPEAMWKNWNFPKPNESHHGPIRKYYLLQMNRKDAAKQILRLDHKSLHLDQMHLKQILDKHALEDDENETLDDHSFSGHIYIGSPQKSVMLASIEENFCSCTFQNFHKKLSNFLNEFLPAHNIPIPGEQSWFLMSPTNKVNYESTVDWKIGTDYLWCNPSFHRHECFDCALVQSIDQHQNEKLIFQLRLKHLHSRPLSSSEIIPLWSIVQGALVAPDFKCSGNYFLMNYIDTDMFLRS